MCCVYWELPIASHVGLLNFTAGIIVTADSFTFCDTLLEEFGIMSRQIAQMMSITVQTHRQVWLSQSNLTEAALRILPIELGKLLDPATHEALHQTIQAGQTRQQLVGLRRMPPPDGPPVSRLRGPSATSRIHLQMLTHFTDRRDVQRPAQRPAWEFWDTAYLPFRQLCAPEPAHPLSRAARGRGARH